MSLINTNNKFKQSKKDGWKINQKDNKKNYKIKNSLLERNSKKKEIYKQRK